MALEPQPFLRNPCDCLVTVNTREVLHSPPSGWLCDAALKEPWFKRG